MMQNILIWQINYLKLVTKWILSCKSFLVNLAITPISPFLFVRGGHGGLVLQSEGAGGHGGDLAGHLQLLGIASW